MFKSGTPGIPIVLLSALILALPLTMLVSEDQRHLYLDITLVVNQMTDVEIFFDTGRGFSQAESRKRRIAASDKPQTLRFALAGFPVHSIRLDFDYPTPSIIVKQIGLIDLLTGQLITFPIAKLHPMHDVASAETTTTGTRFVAAGRDPQLYLSLEGNGRSLQIPFGPFLAITFMLFPPLWLAFRWPTRHRCADGPRWWRLLLVDSWQQAACIAVGVVLWGLAGWYSCNDPSGYIEVAPIEHRLDLYTHHFGGSEVWLERSDGLKIKGIIYHPTAGNGPFPALLLLHGNYPEGQLFPLYPILAEELTRHGFLVMTIDFAGFGSSGDPFENEVERDLSLEMETRSALAYLTSLKDVDNLRVGIIGHSMGADPALRVGLVEEGVGTIMLIGPPRRVQERFYNPPEIEYFWYRTSEAHRQLYGGKALPVWYNKEKWRHDAVSRDMLYLLPNLAGFRHKPVLFIDGERELETDHQFLARFVEECSFPKGYLTLPRTDHDCNIHPRDNEIIYDHGSLSMVAREIDSWCDKTMKGRPNLEDYGMNLMHWLFSRCHLIRRQNLGSDAYPLPAKWRMR